MKVPGYRIDKSMGKHDFLAIKQLGENLLSFLCDISSSRPASLSLFYLENQQFSNFPKITSYGP